MMMFVLQKGRYMVSPGLGKCHSGVHRHDSEHYASFIATDNGTAGTGC
jgi:hypothetical protein